MSVALWCSWIVSALACLFAWYCQRELELWMTDQELHEQQDHATIRQWAERAHTAEAELDSLRKEHFIQLCLERNTAEFMARARDQGESNETSTERLVSPGVLTGLHEARKPHTGEDTRHQKEFGE